MEPNGKTTSSHTPGRPSAARLMARAKLRSMRRERARRERVPGEVPQPSPGPDATIGPRTVPSKWSPEKYAVERAAYARRKPDLLREAPGKYVVFVGEAMIGPFDDFPSAVEAGRRTFGFRPIFTKQVLAEEPAAETGTTL